MKFSLDWPWRRAAPAPDAPAASPEPAPVDMLADLRRDWDENGFAVLPGFYDQAALDAAESEVRTAWERKAPRIVVDDLVTGRRLRLCDVDDDARRDHRFKTNDLYLESGAVRALALNDRITPILAALLGHTPVLCNSLSFEQGSGQTDHVDALYMTPRSQHHLIAIWVALEDCHVDAGPLRYFPGSHRIPPYVFSTGSNHFVQEEMPQWHAYMERECAQRGLQPATFAARKGDVFIWSAYLLHGGSPIADPAKTRKSVVFHYYSEEDSVAQGVTLVPEAGAYWMHRSHQPVPGAGPSDAPPLPANARIAA
jgi:phytanoyl-CoA hydroxylase